MVSQVGNPLLTKMVMQLRDDMRLYGIDSSEGLKRQKESVEEHYRWCPSPKTAKSKKSAR
ncbi:hypothetical protein [Caballeronia fortuita]|uniref:hypothetical protein n=1 Tax=Caballeronia fortuita TaxID=1777138 RepID=UPI003133BB18